MNKIIGSAVFLSFIILPSTVLHSGSRGWNTSFKKKCETLNVHNSGWTSYYNSVPMFLEENTQVHYGPNWFLEIL